MQLRKMTLLIAALGLSLAACGGDDRTSLTCDTDASCLENELCHPQAKVCVQTCAGGTSAECPSSSKTCEALSSTDTRKVCKCSTDALCQTSTAVGDATTLKCDTTYKVCSTGTAATTCTTNADCSAGQVCDTTAKQCKAGTPTGAACTGSSQSTCAYGQFCNGSTCAAAPEAPATCENFSKNRPPWSSATTSGGPVIYSVAGTSYQVKSSYCDQNGGAPDAFLIRVRAYRTDANWPDTRDKLSGFFYVNTGSSQTDVVNAGLLIPNTGYNRSASNLKDAEFNVYLCRPTNSQTIQVGFYFTGGNPVCENVNR